MESRKLNKEQHKHLKLLYEGEELVIIQDTKKLTLNIYKDNKLVDTCNYEEDENFKIDLLDYIYKTFNIELNVCSNCGKIMNVGYCIDSYCEIEYYCSDECLYKHYTEEEYNQMYEDNEAYWTEWN